MSRWNAVLFDLDDTLYPERQFVLGGFRAVSQELQRTHSVSAAETLDELNQIFHDNGPRDHVFDRWLAGRGIDDHQLLQRMIRVYRGHEPKLELFDGIGSLLGQLSSAKRLGLVSDGLLDVQRRKLAALGIRHFFQAVVFSDQWGRDYWKPHPRPFQAVLEQLDTPPTDAVYVGDNPRKDFAGCRSLGIATIRLAVPGGVYTDESPATAAHAPDQTVHTVAELGSLLVHAT